MKELGASVMGAYKRLTYFWYASLSICKIKDLKLFGYGGRGDS
jgi:hypothetical protein